MFIWYLINTKQVNWIERKMAKFWFIWPLNKLRKSKGTGLRFWWETLLNAAAICKNLTVVNKQDSSQQTRLAQHKLRPTLINAKKCQCYFRGNVRDREKRRTLLVRYRLPASVGKPCLNIVDQLDWSRCNGLPPIRRHNSLALHIFEIQVSFTWQKAWLFESFGDIPFGK